MIEEKSKEYGDSYIKNSNLYPLINDHRRKQLITIDVYQMEESFEDGAVWMLNEVINWLDNNWDKQSYWKPGDHFYMYSLLTDLKRHYGKK
jgi:hypothetical protein